MKKVIWSVDAFEAPAETMTHVVSLARLLATQTGAKVVPVSVLSPEHLDVHMDLAPTWAKQLKTAAKHALDQRVKDAKATDITVTSQIVLQKRPSLSQSVLALDSFARVNKADLILLGSHGRRGLPRLLLGSFAEALILHTKVPVLIAGQSSQPLDGINTIAYATDFSRSGLNAYKKALRLARELKAKLCLIHVLQTPAEPLVQSGVYLMGGGWIGVDQYMSTQEIERKKEGERWKKLGEKAKVHVELQVVQGKGNISSTIISESARMGAQLIAMNAQGGPMRAALLGSVTRQVVRDAKSPVWVVR